MALPPDLEVLLAADAALRERLEEAYESGACFHALQKSVNLFARWESGPLAAEARLLKTGRRLAVGEATLHADGRLVAHVTATYRVEHLLSKPISDIS